MTTTQNLYGLILAGGFSKRMGQDKALLVYHGKPQIEYVGNLLQRHCHKVFLSKRSNQTTYQEMPAIDDAPEFSDMGPLGGILSAMKTHPNVSWLVMACDLPFVTDETIKYLIANRNPTSIATAFKSTQEGLPEPLCTIWEAHGYPKLEEFQKQDIRCPRKILIKSNAHLVVQSNPKWLDNVNDPKEYAEAVTVVRNGFKPFLT